MAEKARFGAHSGQVPNLSYIVQDQCHDMHGTSTATTVL